jgi:hypothetical protein
MPQNDITTQSLSGRGFTLLDKASTGLHSMQKNLSNRVKGRGDQTVSILSTPTLALPHRRGRRINGEISNVFG